MTENLSKIVRPQPVSIRKVWAREDTDFTPWLADNLDWLDCLEMGQLACEATEVFIPAWNRSLDILARTGDGRRVAIENQYLEADHDHLTRGLAYAIGLKAVALVIVAEHHRDEFLAVADYMNRSQEQMGEGGIAVFMVNLAVEAVGDFLVPRFTVVARPNEWLADVHESTSSGALADADSFLAACDDSVRVEMEAVISEWRQRPAASFRTGKGTLSLDIPHPFKPGHPTNSIFLLNTNGSVVIQRGYYLESGAFGNPPDPNFLDQKIGEHFPGLSSTAKNYFPTIATPDSKAIREFADWLLEFLVQAVVN